MPPQHQSDLDSGRFLRVDAGSRSVLWPYDDDGALIGGFDAVIAGAGDIAPAELVEVVLLTAEDRAMYPRVPASTACELGFISPAERDALVTSAAQQTRSEIAGALSRLLYRVDEAGGDALRAAADDGQGSERLGKVSPSGLQAFQWGASVAGQQGGLAGLLQQLLVQAPTPARGWRRQVSRSRVTSTGTRSASRRA